jgi:acetylornithine deacetylase/succinyl-diaminopimelate desuccinylase-like protein
MSLSAIDLAADLVRFDTINPPGQEAACTDHLARLLIGAGFQMREGAARRRPAQSTSFFDLPGAPKHAPPRRIIFGDLIGKLDVLRIEYANRSATLRTAGRILFT